MFIEYAGQAERQVGRGTLHNVRAWWNAVSEDQGKVKRAALGAVRAEIPATSRASFVSWGMDTSTHPTINAFITVRVLSAEEAARLARLKAIRAHACHTCSDPHPGYYADVDGIEKALCYVCTERLAPGTRYRLIAWIRADGRLQV